MMTTVSVPMSRTGASTEVLVDEAQFRDFVAEHGAALTRTARLLTGDHHYAEDLTQNVLMKIYLRWSKIDEPLAYARKALVTAHIDSTRRRWWWSERPTEVLPDSQESTDTEARTADHDQLHRLLRDLSAQERSVVVLRYQCDLSEHETARLLGMPLGTVKSTNARALQRLRVSMTEV